MAWHGHGSSSGARSPTCPGRHETPEDEGSEEAEEEAEDEEKEEEDSKLIQLYVRTHI